MLEAAWIILCVANPLTFAAAYWAAKNAIGAIMSEVQDAVNAVTAQLEQARSEIVAEIEYLEAAVADGTPVDLTALKAAAQALDDVVAAVPAAEAPAEATEAPAEAPAEAEAVTD